MNESKIDAKNEPVTNDFKKENLFVENALRYWLIIASVVGLWAALALTLDDIKLLKAKSIGEEAVLGCNINPIVGCGNVLQSDQASAFGIPNPIIGIVAWSMLLALSILYLRKISLPKFVWIGIQIGVTFAFIFVTWLQYQTIFNLGLLCPWCMVTWLVVIPTFFAVTARNFKKFFPGNFSKNFYKFQMYFTFVWLLLLVTVIYIHFGNSIFA